MKTLPSSLETVSYTHLDVYKRQGPDGTIYVADGYGSQWILRYTMKGEYIDKFGGPGDEDSQFATAHGIAVDYRNKANPTLLVTCLLYTSRCV